MVPDMADAWRDAASMAARAERAYREAHCRAYLASQHKTEAMRKAEADLAAAEHRQQRDLAVIAARALEFMLHDAAPSPESR